MLNRALSIVGALVLFLLGNMAGALVKNDPAWTIPSKCSERDNDILEVLKYVDTGGSKGVPSFVCVVDGDSYTVDASYLSATLFNLGGAYKDGSMSHKDGTSEPNPASTCTDGGTRDQLGLIAGTGRLSYYGDLWYQNRLGLRAGGLSYEFGDDSARSEQILVDQWAETLKAYEYAHQAFTMTGCWFRTPFLVELRKTFYNGTRTVNTEGAPVVNPNDPVTPPTVPGAGTTTPPCTRPDGSTSGNPYDCAPTDSETNCSLIDIPCNLKKLFIPRKEFLSDKLKDGVGLTVKFPLTVADSWMTTVTFADHTFPVGADFSTLTWNEETKDQFRFFAWWSTFLFLLGYLGVPFMGGKRGMADSAKDATVGAAAREAAENDRAEAAYRSLRADDSWKNP